MEKLTVIIKRLIPFEEVDISDDEQLFFDGKLLVTRWFPIKPRNDVGWGISETYLKEGYKVSAFFDKVGQFKYWYWDIIDTAFYREKNKLVVRDLLVDVIVDSQRNITIMDRDEVSEALELGLLSKKESMYIDEIEETILCRISEGNFPLSEAPNGKYKPPSGFVVSELVK